MNWFRPVIGQPTAVQLLTHALNRQRLAPAYLFVGPEGVGRALTARCFLQAILNEASNLSNHPDVLWIEPTYSVQGTLYTRRQLLAADREIPRSAPQIRLEQIRQLSRHLSQPPMAAPRSLVVLTQAETMNEAAANALLKTLEEPGRATLILIAPSPSALLSTIVSRCQKIPFYPLSRQDVEQVLRQVVPPDFWHQVTPALLELGAGSPGAILHAWQTWQEIPEAFRHLGEQLTAPLPLQRALELARDITQSLDVERQLWLLSLMQQQIWQERGLPQCVGVLQQLEQARQYLQQYVQPRLVWEVLLMQLGTL
ncbi:MAG: DNA polymerase III subunit delta' [Thermosynechococcus sp.]|uniref:DNA polymerase III subunit delta' n=1 Tax=Thermosynechococcus sp. TaxID=2814275 RepID=UPI0021FC4487|nr:DNA polymerase III subunit delta' [Thermosynechococcus sp.]BCX12792.1 MAG: DNA polymerase III subunit delta' [Thermosynechococcus sp.]